MRHKNSILPVCQFVIGLLFVVLTFSSTTAQITSENFYFNFTDGGRTDVSEAQYWAVPPGVYSISITAIGGSGGRGCLPQGTCTERLGGFGAIATGNDIPVEPGDLLAIIVGGRGEDGGSPGSDGGGGGGSGVVNTAGSDQVLVVAGGAGGGGGHNFSNDHVGQDGEASQGAIGDGGMGLNNMAGGAGGGGINSPGGNAAGMGANNAKGGSAGGSMGGAGGAAGANAASRGGSDGGFGLGGGGGAGNLSGGGGGGATGGNAGAANQGAGGGQSYVTPSAASSEFDNADTRGNGMVVISYDSSDVIPTLSQWGLIILGLSLSILGFVALRTRRTISVRA